MEAKKNYKLGQYMQKKASHSPVYIVMIILIIY